MWQTRSRDELIVWIPPLEAGWGGQVLFTIVPPSFGHTAHIYNLFVVVLFIKEVIDIDLQLDSEYSRNCWRDITRCCRKIRMIEMSYF